MLTDMECDIYEVFEITGMKWTVLLQEKTDIIIVAVEDLLEGMWYMRSIKQLCGWFGFLLLFSHELPM